MLFVEYVLYRIHGNQIYPNFYSSQIWGNQVKDNAMDRVCGMPGGEERDTAGYFGEKVWRKERASTGGTGSHDF